MTTAIIISLCAILLIAYLFELSSAKTRIPSVILLLLSGWVVRQITQLFELNLPDFTPLLPVLGTIGLILIVLEGSLELELHSSKKKLIAKALIAGLLPLLILSLLLAQVIYYHTGGSFRDCVINAIPLAVISSAIAIPSARNMDPFSKEFVIYESSFSDIIGVLLFNFIYYNSSIDAGTVAVFSFQLIIMIIISLITVAGLALLLGRLNHHIKFVPIILLIILIYSISKIYHLPGLLFILVFGLLLGNLDELKRFSFVNKLQPDKLDKEVKKFMEITIEGTFIIRAFFFLLFGYLMKAEEVINPDTLLWSAGITLAIFIIRGIQLKLLKIELFPLLFMAPRGLITILLFLSIESHRQSPLINRSLIIQVVIFTALIMMIGALGRKNQVMSLKSADASNENN